MYSAVAWCIVGFAVALLIVLWHYVVWRELDKQMQTLRQLAAQAALNFEASQKAQAPYEDSAQHALEISLSVYRKAAKEYNLQRCKPLFRIPARLMGFSIQPEELDDWDCGY